jgi:hypothetical protein
VFCSAFGIYLDKRAWIATLIIPIMVTMTIIKELDQIAPFSAAANVLLIYSIVVVIYAEIVSFL